MSEKTYDQKLQELKEQFCKNCTNPIPSDKCAHAVFTSTSGNSALRCLSFNSMGETKSFKEFLAYKSLGMEEYF